MRVRGSLIRRASLSSFIGHCKRRATSSDWPICAPPGAIIRHDELFFGPVHNALQTQACRAPAPGKRSRRWAVTHFFQITHNGAPANAEQLGGLSERETQRFSPLRKVRHPTLATVLVPFAAASIPKGLGVPISFRRGHATLRAVVGDIDLCECIWRLSPVMRRKIKVCLRTIMGYLKKMSYRPSSRSLAGRWRATSLCLQRIMYQPKNNSSCRIDSSRERANWPKSEDVALRLQ